MGLEAMKLGQLYVVHMTYSKHPLRRFIVHLPDFYSLLLQSATRGSGSVLRAHCPIALKLC